MSEAITRRSLRQSTGLLVAILVMILAAGLSGCASTSGSEAADEASDTGSTGSEFTDGSSTEEVVVSETIVVDFEIAPIYFDFDSAQIRSDATATLEEGASVLKGTGAATTIAGHTDARGSEEYNLALGERRASSVRKYLYNLGVPMSQMSIVSYGEAQPAVQGSGEGVWARNRRANFRGGR